MRIVFTSWSFIMFPSFPTTHCIAYFTWLVLLQLLWLFQVLKHQEGCSYLSMWSMRHHLVLKEPRRSLATKWELWLRQRYVGLSSLVIFESRVVFLILQVKNVFHEFSFMVWLSRLLTSKRLNWSWSLDLVYMAGFT